MGTIKKERTYYKPKKKNVARLKKFVKKIEDGKSKDIS